MEKNIEKILQSEINHWDKIALKKNEEHILSYADYMASQSIVWKTIHGLAFNLCGQDITGKNVLDFGCGSGIASLVLAEKGADVIAYDLSPEMVNVTLNKAKLAGLSDKITGFYGKFTELKAKAETFDIIFTGAVLHHLPEFQLEITELSKLLKEKGKLVAYEPFDSNIARFVRNYIPYRNKYRTEDETPLGESHYLYMKKIFKEIQLFPFGPFTALERFANTNSPLCWKFFTTLDKMLSFTGNSFTWYMVFVATK